MKKLSFAALIPSTIFAGTSSLSVNAMKPATQSKEATTSLETTEKNMASRI